MNPWMLLWTTGVVRPDTWRRTRRLFETPDQAMRSAWNSIAPADPGRRVVPYDAWRSELDKRASQHRQLCEVLSETAEVRWLDVDEQPTWLVRRTGGYPLQVWGNSRCLESMGTGIVGTRRLVRLTPDLSEHLQTLVHEAVQVVSGGAIGVDGLAHRLALDTGVPAVIVIAGGLGHAGPSRHRAEYRRIVQSGGALVSSWPAWQEPARWSFLDRNALLAALCEQVVLVRAPLRSGARSTCASARQLGIPVRVVPGLDEPQWMEGNQEEIRLGATWLDGTSDPRLDRASASPVLTGTVDELAHGWAMDVPSTLAWLVLAECRGEAVAQDGGRWSVSARP